MEDELQRSKKNASEATIEVTHLRKLHIKDSISFNIKKDNFEKEQTELRKNVSDKSWALAAKISFLEVELKTVKEKIQLLKESSPWSSDKVRYEWDWSQRFSALQKQLFDVKSAYETYRLGWCRRISKLE